MRPRSSTVETRTDGGAWSPVGTKLNHYAGDDDSPSWIVEDTATGPLTRNVKAIAGGLGATTSKTGAVKLQLTNLHGDVNVVFDVANGTAEVLSTDEYGVPKAGQPATRYGWLGREQRSAEAQAGTMLMGVRLYSPALGRFLQVDPAVGASDSAYGYCAGDPVSCTDTTGYGTECERRWWTWWCGQVLNLGWWPVRIAQNWVGGWWGGHAECPCRTLWWGWSSRWFFADTDAFMVYKWSWVTPGWTWWGFWAGPWVWYKIPNTPLGWPFIVRF